MSNFIDLTNKKFNHLTVLSYAGKNLNNKTIWNCKCDCGNDAIVMAYYLRTGNTKTCGQSSCEFYSEIKRNSQIDHGMTNTVEYQAWENIKKRCFNKNTINYGNWGGRGITMYAAWIHNFKEFNQYLEQLSETRFQFELRTGFTGRQVTLDRIDVNKNYEPGNIRWASAETQAQNRNYCVLNEELVKKILFLNQIKGMNASQILLELPEYTGERRAIYNVISRKTWKNIMI